MKTLLTSLLVTAALLPAMATQHTINVSDFSYSPANLTINLGDTVNFHRVSGSHPTESSNGAFPGFAMSSANPNHQLILTAAGTYPYHCVPHQSMGMVGVITVNGISGAPAFAKTAEVSVYPNPATDLVNITYNLPDVDGIKITNMIGQQVRYVKPGFDNSGPVQVNLAELPKGIYLVNLQVKGTTVFTRRLIKNR